MSKDFEFFSSTANLRWVEAADDYEGPTADKSIWGQTFRYKLQQSMSGSAGSVKWMDIPVDHLAKP